MRIKLPFFKFSKLTKRAKVLLATAVFLCLVLLLYTTLEGRIKPLAASLAQSHVHYVISKALNQAILDTLTDGQANVEYSELITVTTDANGNVSMLQSNASAMNKLAAETASNAQDRIKDLEDQKIGISLGTLTESPLLANKGPKIYFTITPVGSVNATFSSQFSDAGINQTLHRVIIHLEAKIYVVVSGKTYDTEVISTEWPIAESLIVGSVPETYLYAQSQDDLLNLVPSD